MKSDFDEVVFLVAVRPFVIMSHFRILILNKQLSHVPAGRQKKGVPALDSATISRLPCQFCTPAEEGKLHLGQVSRFAGSEIPHTAMKGPESENVSATSNAVVQ